MRGGDCATVNWILLQKRSPLPWRDAGIAARELLDMKACSFNVMQTLFLPGSAYQRAALGAKTLSDTRQALEQYDFAADAPSLTRLLEAIGPTVTLRCSPIVPPQWAWFDPQPLSAPQVCQGLTELQEGIRSAWLKMLDPEMMDRARSAGVTENAYLSATAMAVLAQSAELHPGLLGRTWSPDPGLAQPDVIVQCRLGADDATTSSWLWRVTPSGEVLERPAPLPIDESPIVQSARLAAVLADHRAHPCTLDWSWDGQELTFVSALPVAPHTGVRAFSRREVDHLTPRPLSPMAGDVVAKLLLGVIEDVVKLLPDNSQQPVPLDIVRAFQGHVYLDTTFVRTVLRDAGLPPEPFMQLLFQQKTDAARLPFTALLRLPRAAVAVRFAVLRMERWIGDSGNKLAGLDLVQTDATTVRDTVNQIHELLSFIRPLVMNLLLLSVSSSLRSDSLRRSLERRHLERHVGEALEAASDTAGLDPWTHLDRIAASISDETARLAKDALSRNDPDQAMAILGSDVTILRDLEAFMRSFAFFRTAVLDVGSPTLGERAELLPVAVLRARETGAAERVKAARDPIAWLRALPGGDEPILRQRYRATIRTAAASEKAWFYLAKSLSRARMLLLHAGDLLVEQGHLDSRDEVMLFSLDELEQTSDLREIVRERTTSAQTGAEAPPEVILLTEQSGQDETTASTPTTGEAPQGPGD